MFFSMKKNFFFVNAFKKGGLVRVVIICSIFNEIEKKDCICCSVGSSQNECDDKKKYKKCFELSRTKRMILINYFQIK